MAAVHKAYEAIYPCSSKSNNAAKKNKMLVPMIISQISKASYR